MSDLDTQIAKIRAHQSWSKTVNREARTRAARQAAWEAILAAVDPDGQMSEKDREKAAQNAISAHYRAMAIKSHEARRANRQAG